MFEKRKQFLRSNKQLLLTAANVAKKSYGNEYGAKDVFISDAKTDAQLFITSEKDYCGENFDLAIGFRGSSSIQDAITDARIKKKKCELFHPMENGKDVNTNRYPMIHRGFLEQYMSVRDELFREIDNLIASSSAVEGQKKKKVLIASHSLGGALGTIAALDLAVNKPNCDVCNISFGSPRVGDGRFVKLFNETVKNNTRLKHGMDIVSQVPPRIPFNYVHVNGLVKIPSHKTAVPKSGLMGFFQRIRPSYLVTDHMMDNYIDSLEYIKDEK